MTALLSRAIYCNRSWTMVKCERLGHDSQNRKADSEKEFLRVTTEKKVTCQDDFYYLAKIFLRMPQEVYLDFLPNSWPWRIFGPSV